MEEVVTTYATLVNGSKLSAFHREFPWLKQYLGQGKKITALKVERVDNDLGARHLRALRSYRRDPDYSTSISWEHERLLILDVDGSILAQVGFVRYTPPARWWRKNPKECMVFDSSDTLEKALLRLNEQAEKARFVLSVAPSSMAAPASNRLGESAVYEKHIGFDITVYKSSKGMSVPERLEQCVQSEQKKITEAIEKINTVA